MPKNDADMVRDARTKVDMTQEQFGKLLGVSRRTIKRFEAGEPLTVTIRLAIQNILETHETLDRIGKIKRPDGKAKSRK